jgi:hypothetical protein
MSWDIIVDETEWWDRVAAAVDLLERRPGLSRLALLAAGRAVAVVTDRPVWTEPRTEEPPRVTAYVFDGAAGDEVVRRITQLPDETPADLLSRPVKVFCPDLNSLVCINEPSAGLDALVRRLAEREGA